MPLDTRLSGWVYGLGFLILFGITDTAWGDGAKMNGPVSFHRKAETTGYAETSSVRLVFLETIKLYQRCISPIGGDRCGFRPSCSVFGYEAIREYGPIKGVLMTADRLMRCHALIKRDSAYLFLPNGKLYDPPSKNLLRDP